MTCDKCGNPSMTVRCPLCRRTFGDPATANRAFRVEPANVGQRIADSRHGWQASEDE